MMRKRGLAARRKRTLAGAGRLAGIAMGALACTHTASSAGPAADLDVLHGGTDAQGFTLALEPREFQFPRDHGPHPDFRHEWWYLTGNLDATTGERFGFELTIFRFAVAASAPAHARNGEAQNEDAAKESQQESLQRDGSPTNDSRWRTRQVYMAHFAITDAAGKAFRFAQKYERDALGLAGARATPFRVWLDDWELGVTPGSGARAAGVVDTGAASTGGRSTGARGGSDLASAGADWKLHAALEGYELSLEARPLLPPILNGENGLSRKAGEAGAASYYYSIPRVAVRGRLVRAGRPFDVQGLAWLDREWGSGALGKNEQGWDWFALQLEDGGTLMFYALRNRDGSRDPHSAGTWVDATGHPRPLSSNDMEIGVREYWTSPRGERYPSRWRVRVARLGLDVDVRPVLANQELGTAPRYWEGAVDVKGTHLGQNTSGRGYVELVGYAQIQADRLTPR